MSEKRLFDENLTAEQGLVPVIQTMLLGVDPDEQGVQLDDADWQNVIDAFAELGRMVDHFEAFANDHSMDASTETWAALHCAKGLLARVAPHSPTKDRAGQ